MQVRGRPTKSDYCSLAAFHCIIAAETFTSHIHSICAALATAFHYPYSNALLFVPFYDRRNHNELMPQIRIKSAVSDRWEIG